jgi:glucosamine 6-phosphate synthetase-like amidotransferase/phosphosugar isomerase protein
MCCIFGIGLLKGHQFDNESTLTGIVSRLFKEAESGGRKASGLSIMKEKTVHILRRPMSATQLVSSKEYLDFMEEHIKLEANDNKLMSIIGHCRWPTKGRASNNLNNHPQVIGDIIGVHNGVIGNDDELFSSFDSVITRKARVDTEIIFQLVNHFNKSPQSKTVDAIKHTTPYLRGGYACAMHNVKHPYNFYLFRRGNPIAIKHYSGAGAVIFGTRPSFMPDAYESFVDTKETGQEIEINNKQGIVFNMWNNTMCTFDFEDDTDVKERTANVG